MTDAFALRRLKINTKLDSEGFLYINNTYDPYDNTKTFMIGEITDTNQSIVCPGEIISIMDYEEFESNKNLITHYSRVLKGKKIRIYMVDDDVMISRECEIYPDQLMAESEIKTQINFELLDKKMCYYATIVTTNNNKQIILTYMTEILNPKLENIDLSHDLAFMNHLPIYSCEKESSAMEIFKTKLSNEDNGLIFYRNDGQRFEFWAPIYSSIKTQERPYNINACDYYVLLLNKYPIGKTYDLFFKDLHYDVDIYLSHYPEDKYVFGQMEERLNIYANFNRDYLSPVLEDADKIQKIKKLLYIDVEWYIDPSEIVDILKKFKTNCDKLSNV
jgi:hypothetical protein